MAYWGKMIDHECMIDLIQLEPFSFITSPDEMELVYTMGKLDCLVPANLQRLTWCEDHKMGRDPIKPQTSAIIAPSSEDSYASLISNLEKWTPESDGVTNIRTTSSTGAIPKKPQKKGKIKKSLVTDELSELAQVETRKLILSTAKKMSQITQADKPKDPDDFLGISELADRPVKPLSIKATITEADKNAFNAYINMDEDEDKGKFKIRPKNDDVYQTGPLIFLAQEMCKYSGQPVDDIMENLKKEVPKMSTARYSITTDDVLGIRKEPSQRTMKQNRDCERWALDALDCAKSIDGSFTLNDFIHMLPEEISFREAGDLIMRARANLAVKGLIDRRHVNNDTLDIYNDSTLEIISKRLNLSAIQSAKSSLEPMTAAIMG